MICVYCRQLNLADTPVTTGEPQLEQPGSEIADQGGHRHDTTIWAQHYHCARGHDWVTRWQRPCPRFDCKWPLPPDGPGPVPGSGVLA